MKNVSSFNQDRLGTNREKTLQNTSFSRLFHVCFLQDEIQLKAAQVRKTYFLSHLHIKMMISPRQARDKHRESTQKKRDRFVIGVQQTG